MTNANTEYFTKTYDGLFKRKEKRKVRVLGKQCGLYLLNWVSKDIIVNFGSVLFCKEKIASVTFPDDMGLQ